MQRKGIHENMRDYNFGNFIYQCRTEKGLSQSELGDLMGVTNKAVSKWESGASKPRTDDLVKLSEILGVTVDELILGKHIVDHTESDRVKKDLEKIHRSTALKASIFFTLLLSFPLVLIFFITTVMSLKIPDDVIGPLGAMLLIVLFVVSLTCTLVFSSQLKRLPISAEFYLSDTDRHKMAVRIKCALTASLLSPLVLVSTFLLFDVIAVVAVIIFGLCILAFDVLIFALRYRKIMSLGISNAKETSEKDGECSDRYRVPPFAFVCGVVGVGILCFALFARIWLLVSESGFAESNYYYVYDYLRTYLVLIPTTVGIALYGICFYFRIRQLSSEKHQKKHKK